MKSLRKIWSFFNKKQKIHSIYLLFGVLIATNLEIIGISSFLPIVAAIVDYETIKEYPFVGFWKRTGRKFLSFWLERIIRRRVMDCFV